MFEVDLLKGKGIPVRFRPETAVVIAVMVVVPVLVGLGIAGLYLRNSIALSIQKHTLKSYEDKEDRLAVATEMQKELKRDKAECSLCLMEIKDSLRNHKQWSEAIRTVVQSMPDSVVLREMRVEQRSMKTKVPKKNDPDKKITVSVPVRNLRMSVSSTVENGTDAAVRDFRNRLWASEVLGPELQNIEVSQQQETVEGEEIVSYEINCIFKVEI